MHLQIAPILEAELSLVFGGATTRGKPSYKEDRPKRMERPDIEDGIGGRKAYLIPTA